jgi:hypothetical protein
MRFFSCDGPQEEREDLYVQCRAVGLFFWALIKQKRKCRVKGRQEESDERHIRTGPHSGIVMDIRLRATHCV